MSKRTPKDRVRHIKSMVSPKDLAYSTGWFIGCFLTNVTRLRYDLDLVEAHPVNMESYPQIQKLMFNWRSKSGTAGLYIQFLEHGDCTVEQWFGTDPKLKQQLENIWNQCIQQLARTWSTLFDNKGRSIYLER